MQCLSIFFYSVCAIALLVLVIMNRLAQSSALFRILYFWIRKQAQSRQKAQYFFFFFCLNKVFFVVTLLYCQIWTLICYYGQYFWEAEHTYQSDMAVFSPLPMAAPPVCFSLYLVPEDLFLGICHCTKFIVCFLAGKRHSQVMYQIKKKKKKLGHV